MIRSVAIVGANLAGGRAAETLRAEGFGGSVVLIGSEPNPPYERPPLTKDVLLGRKEPEQTFLRTVPDWTSLGVDLRLGQTATRLIPSERALELSSGDRVLADRVLLCTGGRPRMLEVEGAGLEGVLYVRTIGDAMALRSRLAERASVVVIGAGFIGAEVAACAREMGCQVVMLELADVPLWRSLGESLGRMYGQIHADRGVDLRTGVAVDRITKCSHGLVVHTTAGDDVAADVVVVGVGISPATDLAVQAGIRAGDGILVDEFCRTSIEGVFAAGDVANHPNQILNERIRVEHWQNAQNQAIAAARSILGGTEPFNEVPWFWSDQYGLNLQVAGHPRASDEVIWRGESETLHAIAFYLRDGVLVGSVALDRARDMRAALRLIAERARPDTHQLADESVDLRRLSLPSNGTLEG